LYWFIQGIFGEFSNICSFSIIGEIREAKEIPVIRDSESNPLSLVKDKDFFHF